VAKKFKKKMFINYFAKFVGSMDLASREKALCCKTMVRRSFCVAATSETHFFRHSGVHMAVLVVGVLYSRVIEKYQRCVHKTQNCEEQ